MASIYDKRKSNLVFFRCSNIFLPFRIAIDPLWKTHSSIAETAKLAIVIVLQRMYAMLRRAMLVVWRFGKITLAQYFQHNAESNHFRRTPFSNFLWFRYEIYYSRSFSRAIESLSVLSVRKRRIPNNALVHGHLNECVCFN